jgi:catechol 2,3-dioxygenase
MTTRDPITSPGDRLDPGTAMGTVALTVPDLARSRAFYTDVLGMSALASASERTLSLGAPDGNVLLELVEDAAAPPRNPRQTGLFHFAVLVPSRADLARSLISLAVARWPLSGASDHLVSEALYLNDPDGNGIEIYRDRPRTDWAHTADGELAMGTLALDLDDLVSELGDVPLLASPLAAGTRMGHVHLQVSELAEIEAFYAGVLGFDVTVRSYPGALFVSAGGYHHHLGLNSWNSRGGSAPDPAAAGLRWYEVRVGSPASLEAALGRASDAGLEIVDAPGGALLRDPSGNHALLSAGSPAQA